VVSLYFALYFGGTIADNHLIFCTFVPVQERTINPIYSPFKTHSIMNKTWKTILQVISYVITLLLGGAAGGAVMM
jgi:hypothetical protein